MLCYVNVMLTLSYIKLNNKLLNNLYLQNYIFDLSIFFYILSQRETLNLQKANKNMCL